MLCVKFQKYGSLCYRSYVGQTQEAVEALLQAEGLTFEFISESEFREAVENE